jgi:hypothetical protein
VDRNWRPPAAIAILFLVVGVGGCAMGPTDAPRGTPTSPGTAPPIEPTPVTGAASVIESPWGPIWDAVPPEFLVFAGAQPVEIEEPVSVALDHPAQAASPADIANAYVTDLTIGGWRTVVSGPIEDGSIVVDAVRDGTTCRAQVRATPLGGIVRITVLYGSGCPPP